MEAAKYDPAQIEGKWYQYWESNGLFEPKIDENKPSFAIQLPPPNVTGTLHMGHAFNQTIMDGLTRYYRMRGYNTAWVPGTDHAGIATQIVVERQLSGQGINRHDLGREAFLNKIWSGKRFQVAPLPSKCAVWAAQSIGRASISPWMTHALKS